MFVKPYLNRTTAMIVAMSLLAAGPVVVTKAVADNTIDQSGDQNIKQSNKASIKQNQECEANAVQVGVQFGDNTAENNCKQEANIDQKNVAKQDQTRAAAIIDPDICVAIAGVFGINVC